MSKADIERGFQMDFDNPGSLKSGEYLRDHILNRARRFVGQDRESLVLVLRDWLQQRCEPQTMLAVSVAGELRLVELRGDLESLHSDVKRGAAFLPYYLPKVKAAIRRVGTPES